MPIFSKPNAIVYVRHGGLIVAGKKLKPARINFTAEHVQNLELLDEAAFTNTLTDFFGSNGLKGKHVLMVLDDSVVFNKTATIETSKESAGIADEFIAAMPLNPGQRACVRTLTDSELELYGTNGDLYVAIADALDQAGAAKLLAITPAAAYPSEGGKQQLAAAVQQFISDTTVRASANFQNADIV